MDDNNNNNNNNNNWKKKVKATLPSHMSIFILSFKQDFIVLQRSCTYWIQALSS